MPRMFVARLVLAVGLAASCTEAEKPPFVPPDGPRPAVDGAVPFLGDCQRDSDCSSGRCLAMGGTSRRCTRTCSSGAPCPALGGWSCSADAVCSCTATGKQPTVCNVDGDCDGTPDRKPGLEICNGEDDDCNGTVDDVTDGASGAKRYYRDADGDGFGDQNNARWLCQKETGWLESPVGDCDDQRQDVHPAATEVCGDGIDHNCNGTKEDSDVCGLTPIVVGNVNDPLQPSGTLKSCGPTAGLDPSLDETEIVAKQDATSLKFTVRLAGAPATGVCSSYTLHFGSLSKVYDIVYVYRPAVTACAGLPEKAVFQQGQPVSSQAVMAFNAAAPGHVSFTIPKSEILPSLPTPSYSLRACTNATADATKDLTACASDSCETPVHR